MRWSLQELRKYQESGLHFEERLDLTKQLLERDNQILGATIVEVVGTITIDSYGYLLQYRLKTTLTLPSSRSLEPVAVPLDFAVTEQFVTPEQFAQASEAMPEYEVLLLEGQTLDVVESILDNILLEIPLQVFTETEKTSQDLPKGQDWEVVSEEDYHKQKDAAATTIDPRLAKLSQLLEETSEEGSE